MGWKCQSLQSQRKTQSYQLKIHFPNKKVKVISVVEDKVLDQKVRTGKKMRKKTLKNHRSRKHVE